MSNRRKIPSVDLLTTGVTAATYGSATAIPVLTFNAQGQVTSATTASPSPDLVLSVQAAATLAAGDLVRVSSVTAAGVSIVDLADADLPSTAAEYVCDAAIASGATGTVSKSLLSAATLNTNGSTVGAPVYLSGTAGAWTLSAPVTADIVQQVVGRVVVVSATVGQILFNLTDAIVSKAGTSFLQSGLTLTEAKLATGGFIADANGNELIKAVATVASAVNEITVANAATGNGPSLTASGETNVPITLAGKGTGKVLLGQATSGGVQLQADQPILDSSGNELIAFVKAATAVNEITVFNAAAGSAPAIEATGGDTNIDLDLIAKGSGSVVVGSGTGGLKIGTPGTALTLAVVYTPTLTPASVAAATVAEEIFAVVGVTTGDTITVNPPAWAQAVGVAGARVSSAGNVAIRFVNPTAGALVPDSGVWRILAFRS